MICGPIALHGSISATLTEVLRMSLHLPLSPGFCCQHHCSSSTFEELFGLFLISSLTDSPPVKEVQPLHVHTCFPCWGEGSQQSPLRPVTHLSGWREAGCPAQDDVLAQGVQMEGGRGGRCRRQGKRKRLCFYLRHSSRGNTCLWSVAAIYWVAIHIIEQTIVSCYTQQNAYMEFACTEIVP